MSNYNFKSFEVKAGLTVDNVHQNQLQTELAQQYLADQSLYIADEVVPIYRSPFKNDDIPVYDPEEWGKGQVPYWNELADIELADFDISTDNFACRVRALGNRVSEQVINNADSWMNPEQDSANFVAQRVTNQKESDMATALMVANTWGTPAAGATSPTDYDPTVAWGAASGSTPREDVEEMNISIELNNAGLRGNVAIMGRMTYSVLKNHAAVREYAGLGTGSGREANVNMAMIASYLDVERVYVLRAPLNTSTALGGSTNAWLHQNAFLLLHLPATLGGNAPTAAMQAIWQPMVGGGQNNIRVDRLVNPYNIQHNGIIAYQYKRLGTTLGRYIANAVS